MHVKIYKEFEQLQNSTADKCLGPKKEEKNKLQQPPKLSFFDTNEKTHN